MIQVAILGHGVVGSGVAEILLTHKESLQKKVHEEISIKKILDLRDFPGLSYSDKFTKNFEDIVNDDEIKVVAEVMGGVNPAFDFVKRCLEANKSVVTSNKELVAKKGAQLLAIAKEHNVNFLFEASVGGGIPIIRPLNNCLVANDVDEIAGILNGTTNFILTKMITESMSFKDALKLAQELGYAERDPSADVEGHDACRKICILASLAFGKHVYPDNIHTEGITNISLEDVAYANRWGGVIKLIGDVKNTGNGMLDIFVAPMLISEDSQLSSIDDVFNGILVRGDATGDVVFYGKGAGKLPTASAVVADIVDCIKHLNARKYLFWSDCDGSNVLPYDESVSAMYVRANGSIKTAQSVFNKITQLHRENAPENEIAFTTNEMKIKEFNEKIKELKENGVEVLNTIRIGDL
ncbi:homoserine dehydrogenase [Oscillospiraceae bacterium LCP25S3_E10]|nr:homoserine dehydrogenase [Ruminococcus sp.]MDD6446433.1 homoserine dehydrogenase [Ruminococcus sp.]MDY2856892.1 homoserine dehydrogenase [Oscillospiraceae bacterium]